MQLLVIAGGLGTRLRPLTFDRPKALVPLLNRPQILYLLDRLPASVDEVLVAVNYKFEEVRAFFGRHKLGAKVTVVHESTPRGTGGAIKNVEDRLRGPFAAFNGDVIDRFDLGAFIRFHEGHGKIASIALWPVEDPSAFGVVALEGDRVTRFVEKPAKDDAPSNLVNAGRYLFEPEIFEFIGGGREVSLEREVFPRILDRGLMGFRYEGLWSDAGTLPSYLNAQRLLLSHKGAGVADDAEVSRGELRAPVLVGEGCFVEGRVGPNVVLGRACRIGRASISDAALFDGVSVDDKADIQASIVGSGAAIGEGAVVRDTIVADGAQVPPHARIVGERVGP